MLQLKRTAQFKRDVKLAKFKVPSALRRHCTEHLTLTKIYNLDVVNATM